MKRVMTAPFLIIQSKPVHCRRLLLIWEGRSSCYSRGLYLYLHDKYSLAVFWVAECLKWRDVGRTMSCKDVYCGVWINWSECSQVLSTSCQIWPLFGGIYSAQPENVITLCRPREIPRINFDSITAVRIYFSVILGPVGWPRWLKLLGHRVLYCSNELCEALKHVVLVLSESNWLQTIFLI